MHTVVIGTSKSKNESGYYIKSKKKFWTLINVAGITPNVLEPNQYKTLIDNYGIGFGELAFDHVFLGEDLDNESITNDSDLSQQLHVLNSGIPKLIKHLTDIKPKRIVFNGKTAVAAFYQFIKNGKVEKLKSGYVKELGFEYGKIDTWNGIEVYMLPNLSNAAGKTWKEDKGEERWLSFWQMVKNDIPKKSKNNLWLIALIIAAIAITIIILNQSK